MVACVVQQLMVEMQAMASRPFASVCVDMTKVPDPGAGGGGPEKKELRDHVDTALRRRKKVCFRLFAHLLIVLISLLSRTKSIYILRQDIPHHDVD